MATPDDDAGIEELSSPSLKEQVNQRQEEFPLDFDARWEQHVSRFLLYFAPDDTPSET